MVPAYIPGEEEKHLGYIGALDENGHPIDVMEEMKTNISKGMGNLDNQQAMNLTSTLTFDAVGNVTDTVTNAYDADGRLICSAAQIGTQQKLGSDSN